MSLKSAKPAQAGHIVIQNQNEDDQSGLIVVSNTGPMEEIDGIYSSKIPSSTQIDQERKRTTSRLQSDMEKSIRIRTTRIPSGKSTQSGKNLLSPVSIPGSKLGQTVGTDGIKSNLASARIEENEVLSPEENKVFEYERVFEGRLDLYNNEEENIVCARFPHLKFCACGVDHEELKNEPPVEVLPGIFISTMHQSLATKNLLALGITHIVNVSATEFTKRRNYFEYLTFDIFDTHEEDVKKHFRITNRFISDALQDGGKVLLHSLNSRSRAPAFILAYMIGKRKKTLKNSMDFIKEMWPRMEINPYFYKQLEQYDLEKLAIGSSIKV